MRRAMSEAQDLFSMFDRPWELEKKVLFISSVRHFLFISRMKFLYKFFLSLDSREMLLRTLLL